ncbi:MAG: YicC/YloC family endoribonuclease [Verrucomicrobiota bacterium]|nr:YicC/YloC family endoribonuclease [Verrucomicrobiota bacterium]|tara:strand:+ start:1510 stop:2391 length:882 start_codon:yes stop_codon:yes gene_type:complete
MKSMTGYGRGECAAKGVHITVELNTVNRKQAEVSLGVPPALESIEPELRDMILASISRGRVNGRVALQHSGASRTVSNAVNEEQARAYRRELVRLAKSLKMPDNLSLETLLRLPGVLEPSEPTLDGKAFRAPAKRALGQALEALQAMREKEGTNLGRDLAKRLAGLRRVARRVARRAPAVLKQHRERLIERLNNANVETPGADDERLLREMVYYTDRMDITEELTRLDSHFAQLEQCLRVTQPVGRKLDFLAQEMFREINTIGSKANDGVISGEVVTLKTELEKIREQVQNVE